MGKRAFLSHQFRNAIFSFRSHLPNLSRWSWFFFLLWNEDGASDLLQIEDGASMGHILNTFHISGKFVIDRRVRYDIAWRYDRYYAVWSWTAKFSTSPGERRWRVYGSQLPHIDGTNWYNDNEIRYKDNVVHNIKISQWRSRLGLPFTLFSG